jgi:hypothetical protein
VADLLIECLVSGITFFIIAYVFVSFADSTFGKALGTSMFLLIFTVLPMIYGVFSGPTLVSPYPTALQR